MNTEQNLLTSRFLNERKQEESLITSSPSYNNIRMYHKID
jgi:hypothetical protein